MTRVDFYILEDSSNEARLNFACRLAAKAVQQDLEVVINVASDPDSARLDELLWTFAQGSFLPHRRLADRDRDDEGEPILIGCGEEPVTGRFNVLINLSAEIPDFFSRFERVAELVGAEASDKDAGRERFRYYRDRGYELHTHKI